ncbi:MAG: phosphosulfolactate synthase, partial [Pseudomonadota bacterium]
KKLSSHDRVYEAKRDLEAGARYVIIEAREGGKSLGVYDETGALKEEMALFLAEEIGTENIMFEAPDKSQQTRLVLLLGEDVNLGNIRPEDVIPLETLRRGIRSDTIGKMQNRNR